MVAAAEVDRERVCHNNPNPKRQRGANQSVERKRHHQSQTPCLRAFVPPISAFLRFYVSAFGWAFFLGLFSPAIVVTLAFVFSIAESESPDNCEGREHEFDSSRSEV